MSLSKINLDERQDAVGRTYLHNAVMSSSFDFFRVLISSGADLNIQDNSSCTPSIAGKDEAQKKANRPGFLASIFLASTACMSPIFDPVFDSAIPEQIIEPVISEPIVDTSLVTPDPVARNNPVPSTATSN